MRIGLMKCPAQISRGRYLKRDAEVDRVISVGFVELLGGSGAV